MLGTCTFSDMVHDDELVSFCISGVLYLNFGYFGRHFVIMFLLYCMCVPCTFQCGMDSMPDWFRGYTAHLVAVLRQEQTN